MPNLAFKTEQLAYYTQNYELENERKANLKGRIHRLQRAIAQEEKLLSSIHVQKGRHVN